MHIKTVTIAAKKVVGMFVNTSLINDATNTASLWPKFMPLLNNIKHRVDDNTLSIKVFDEGFAWQNMHSTYDKWAATEVSSFNDVANDLVTRTLQGGCYAVFLHTGNAASAIGTFINIFTKWLPELGYQLDTTREQFEVLGKNYHPNDVQATEEVWIPVIPIKE